MDTIRIEHLELWTHIGVSKEERKREQRLVISLDLQTDTRKAGTSDSLKKTIDYEAVYKAVQQLISQKHFQLLEACAEEIATHILKDFKLSSVTVHVRKFILPGTNAVSLTITRP